MSTAVVVAMLMAGMMYFRKMESCQKRATRSFAPFRGSCSWSVRPNSAVQAVVIELIRLLEFPAEAGDFLCHFRMRCSRSSPPFRFDAAIPFRFSRTGMGASRLPTELTAAAENYLLELVYLIDPVSVGQVMDSLSCP